MIGAKFFDTEQVESYIDHISSIRHSDFKVENGNYARYDQLSDVYIRSSTRHLSHEKDVNKEKITIFSDTQQTHTGFWGFGVIVSDKLDK